MDDSTEYVLIEDYHSDSESEFLESEKEESVTKTRKSRTWVTGAVFQNREEAMEWLGQNPIWSHEKSYDTQAGRKEMYRCNLVKRRGPQCEKVIHLQFNSHNEGVIRLETTTDHNHNHILQNQKKAGINQVTKESILRQLDIGVKKTKNNLCKPCSRNFYQS